MTMRHDEKTLREAAGWLLRLADEPDEDALRREHELWLSTDPDHGVAWMRINATWGLLVPGGLSGRPSSVSVGEADARPRTRLRFWQRSGLAASAMTALFALWLFVPTILIALQADYRTGTGEMRRVRLADGSSIDLGGHSAIAVQVDAQAGSGATEHRTVKLLQGEAFFDVAADSGRPFIVEAGDVSARVVGTAFDVEITSDGTRIALQHGVLDVLAPGQAPIRLIPGKIVSVPRGGRATVAAIAPGEIGAWRGGKVVLTDVPVRAAIDLIRRYSTAWIAVADNTLLARRVSGLIDLSDPDAALAALVEPFGATAYSVSPLARLVTRW